MRQLLGISTALADGSEQQEQDEQGAGDDSL